MDIILMLYDFKCGGDNVRYGVKIVEFPAICFQKGLCDFTPKVFFSLLLCLWI